MPLMERMPVSLFLTRKPRRWDVEQAASAGSIHLIAWKNNDDVVEFNCGLQLVLRHRSFVSGKTESLLTHGSSVCGLAKKCKQGVRASMTSTVSPVQIGSSLGRYLLIERLGQGAVGEVYKALHQGLNIPVAIKLLKPGSHESSQDLCKRLREEARILAQVNHPCILRPIDFDETGEHPYLVMDYVDGGNLAELIDRSGGLRLEQALRIIQQAAEGLAAAHKLGVCHRDIKPANILLTRDGWVRLADFGQAVLVGQQGGEDKPPSGLSGTPLYMAPEQFKGGQVDPKTDIYSLGATFYHAVAGQPPFEGTNVKQLMYFHLHQQPAPPHELIPELPAKASEVILTMMAKDPDERYESGDDLLLALRELQELLPPTTRGKDSRRTVPIMRPKPVAETESSRPPTTADAETTAARASANALMLMQEGIAAARAGRKDDAKKSFLEAIRLKPNSEMGWMWLASVSPDAVEAEHAYQQVLKLNPANTQAQDELQNLRGRHSTLLFCPFCKAPRGKGELICQVCSGVLSLDRVERFFHSETTADVARFRGLITGYEEQIRKGGGAPTFYCLGLAHLTLRQFGEAIKALEGALTMRPNDQILRVRIDELRVGWQTQLMEAARRKRILVVEDEPTIREFISCLLQAHGYQVVTAADGYEAIQAFGKQTPDAILLDLMLPGADGYQVCRVARADQRTAKTPIIMLTGKDGLLDSLKGRMAGATAYLSKPVNADQLLSCLDKHCPRPT